MALTLNAEQKSIYDIFSGENQYIIPPYQRAYSWTNIQCKALFEDIKKAFYNEEQEGYFLGNIVLAKSRENKNKLEVIDGQQRLTTLILLIKVLLSFDKENKALYNAIWIKDRRTDEEIQRLETNIFMEQDYNYFKEVLAFDFSDNICESINKEDNFFKQNICYLYNKLKEFSQNNDIFKFADFLLDKIYILPIETEDSNADKARKNALQVFETINNRGLNLSTADILKARLYSMALNELKHKDFIGKWKILYKKCSSTSYSINELFEMYASVIQETDTIHGINLIEFFLENKNSPFFNKKYDEILDDLFKIVNPIIYFQEVLQNSNKYGELTKWFQLVRQASLSSFIPDNTLLISIYKMDYLNSEKSIDICKKIIRENVPLYYKERSDNGVYRFSSNDSFYILLGLYLDEKIKGVYPYYLDKRITLSDLMDYGLIDRTQIEEREYRLKLANLINKKAYDFLPYKG